MTKASVIQTTFNTGELSPKIDGRVDLQKYSNGVKLIENFLLTPQGPAIRRGGTRFVGAIKNSSAQSWLLRFEFNTTQAYVLEFGNLYVRFWANHGQVLASGATAYNGATAYTPGALVTNAGVTYNCIAATTGNAPPNATYWYPLTGSILELPSPYTTADLTDTDGTMKLRFAQSGDVIYIAHPAHLPQKLTRVGPSASNWTLGPIANSGGPFKNVNSDPLSTVWASALTGNVTLNASLPIFTAAMVGALFYLKQKDASNIPQWQSGIAWTAGNLCTAGGANYVAQNSATGGGVEPVHSVGTQNDGSPGVSWLYEDSRSGWVQITGFTSATQVTALVLQQLPSLAVSSSNPTSRWALGAFNDTDGYPSQVTFFRERLVFAANQQVWMSVTGDYENFNPRDEFGQIQQDRAITITIVARKVNKTQWLDPGPDLLIGTAGGEFSCSEMTANQVFGPSNITVRPQSEYGSKAIAPHRIGNSVLYVQRSGRKVRELGFDAAMQVYKSTDITIMAEHVSRAVTVNPLGYTGFLNSDFQQEPYMVIWYTRADGMLVGLTFNREQDVIGFHRHPIGGNGFVESVSCIPAPDASRNELWMIVRRVINGATVRYIEYIELEHQEGDDIEQAYYVDAGLSYDGKVNATLTLGAGANTAHSTGVVLTAGSAVFVAGDVGRSIHYRYQSSTADASGAITTVWTSAKATITAYTDSTHVVCNIDVPFPVALATLAANSWRMTVTSLSGFGHLEGATVDVLVNGASHPQVVVTGGTVALQNAGSVVHVGLSCPCRLWTMRLNAGAADGTSQGKTARINKLAIRFSDTLGAQFGPDSAHLDDLPFRSTGDNMDQPPLLFTGDKVMEFDGDYNNDPRVYIENSQPFPTTIIAIMPQTHVYDR